MQIFAKIVGLFPFIFGLLFYECQNGTFKLVFQRGKLKLVKPPAHENQRVNRHRNLRISENFAEHPLCPVPNHRIADPFARNNSEPRLRTGLFGARHIQNKGGTIRLHSIFFYIIEVFLQTHSIFKSKAHYMPSFAKQILFCDQAFAAFLTARCYDASAAACAHARAETAATYSLQFRWAVCRIHDVSVKINKVKASKENKLSRMCQLIFEKFFLTLKNLV